MGPADHNGGLIPKGLGFQGLQQAFQRRFNQIGGFPDQKRLRRVHNVGRGQAEVEKSRGKPVQRVNAVLALAGRASPDAAFYEALLKRLVDTARLAGDAPRQLADTRARVVAAYLAGDLSVPGERVVARTAGEAGEPRVKLALDAAAPAPAATSPRD